MVNPVLKSLEKFPNCDCKEFFKILNSFHLVKFFGPGMRSTCSCKDYVHDKFCVHVWCVIAMLVLEFQIPVALIQCDPELRRRRAQIYCGGGYRTGRGERKMESYYG